MWRKIQQKMWRDLNGKLLPIYNFGSVQNMEQESSVASTNLIFFSLPSYEVISATFILIFNSQWEQRLQLSCPLKVFHVPNFAQTYISHMKKSNHIPFRNLHGKCRCQIKIEWWNIVLSLFINASSTLVSMDTTVQQTELIS